MTTLDILKRTKAAWPSICNASAEDKNRILSAMAGRRAGTRFLIPQS